MSQFNNIDTDRWNILINNTNNNTISSFGDQGPSHKPHTDKGSISHTDWMNIFNPTSSLSLHTFCHHMMEMDGCILVILWTSVMHPASNHLLPVDMMCEILTKEWNSKFFLSVLEKTLTSVRDDEATTESRFLRRNDTTQHKQQLHIHSDAKAQNWTADQPRGGRSRTSRGRWWREQQTKVSVCRRTLRIGLQLCLYFENVTRLTLTSKRKC